MTKFGGVVGSLSETTQKKFELARWRGRRAGGSQRAPSFEKTMFFCFFQLVKMAGDFWNSTKKGAIWVCTALWTPPSPHQPSRIKTQTFSKGSQKVADRKNREFFIFQKIQFKGLVPRIHSQIIFFSSVAQSMRMMVHIQLWGPIGPLPLELEVTKFCMNGFWLKVNHLREFC